MGLGIPELFDDILSHMALAGINDDPVENINVHRHKRFSHRAIAKFKCLNFTKLPAVYDVHGVIPEDRCRKAENRGQISDIRYRLKDP